MTLLSTDLVDLSLDANGDLAIIDGDCPLTKGKAGLVQAVRVSILLGLGEFFLELGSGTDWFGSILGRNYDEARARATISASILAVNGITAVTNLSLSLDVATRTLTIRWAATASFGDSVADTLVAPV